MANNLKLVQDSFKNQTGVMILSHSVTPENDSVPVLKRYEKNFDINGNIWYLLTGKREDVYTIARKAYFADEDLGMKKDVNDFLHTENILLIDQHKRIRGVYKGTAQNEVLNMIADIKLLQLEE